jgi:hypothetical protein
MKIRKYTPNAGLPVGPIGAIVSALRGTGISVIISSMIFIQATAVPASTYAAVHASTLAAASAISRSGSPAITDAEEPQAKTKPASKPQIYTKPDISITPHLPLAELEKRQKVYAPVHVKFDESILAPPEVKALKHLVKTAHIMDEIFLRQVWSGNVAMRDALLKALQADAKSEKSSETAGGMQKAREDRALLHFFRLNFGPWDRIDKDAPFIGTLAKPAGANYYPAHMTKAEFDDFLKKHPDKEKTFRGFFTTIRRADGTLKAVPYSEEYKLLLKEAAAEMRAAADILTDPASKGSFRAGADYTTLAKFLRSRAEAFLTNDYFQSDMDWMDVTDNIIDVTIGPYEVYEDALFGYKASFEAFIAIRNPADSKKLHGLKSYLQTLENNLPIPDQYKNPNRGSESPISVVDVAFTGGDAKAGVQTIAFNLPNDERVREAKGSKKVMLKNISKAKFDKILIPIAKMFLDPSQMKYVDFETFFGSTLMHEFAHGLGPGNIVLPDGTKTSVSKELKDLYPSIEEAKADILGLYNTAYLVKDGFFPEDMAKTAYVTFLPGFFRAIRFGIHEAHGKANMMEFNFIMEKGGFTFDSNTGKYHVDFDKMPGAVKEMANKLLMIEATGDYAAAKAFIEKYGKMPHDLDGMLKNLVTIPVDVEPIFDTAKSYLKE